MSKTKPNPVDDPLTEAREIANVPEIVSAFGKQYAIKKFAFGAFTQAFEYVGPLGYLLKRIMDLPRDAKGHPIMSESDALDFAVTAISISGPSVMGLVSVATREPVEWLEEQEDVMGGVRLFSRILARNIDFFSPENLKMYTEMFGDLMRKIPASGGESSTT